MSNEASDDFHMQGRLCVVKDKWHMTELNLIEYGRDYTFIHSG